MATNIEIVGLTPNQVSDGGQVLGRAFLDDPLILFVLPDEEKRERATLRVMTAMTRYGTLRGTVDTTSGTVDGVAMWFPPGETGNSIVGMFRSGLIMAMLRAGFSSARRFSDCLSHGEKLHKRDMPGDHMYLPLLGVEPNRQGQGIGSALLAPGLARADSAGLPCYLETSRERNLPFYTRHGFEVIVEDNLPNGGPRMWTMKREPR